MIIIYNLLFVSLLISISIYSFYRINVLSLNFYLVSGYILSIISNIKYFFSIEYYIYLISSVIVCFLIEIIYYNYKKRKKLFIKERKKINIIFIIIFLISLSSFIYMILNFFKNYGFISPLNYSYIYEEHLYLPFYSILYRSCIPLFIYSLYKVSIEKDKKKIYYIVIFYCFISLFIKFNKADMYILFFSFIIMKILNIKKKLNIKLLFKYFILFVFIFIGYFYIFNKVIFNDTSDIIDKFKLYLGSSQIYFDKIITKEIILKRESINFLNIFLGEHEGIPFFIFENGLRTNVIGFLGEIFLDFHYYGIFFIGILFLLFYSSIYFFSENYILKIFLSSFLFFSFFSGFIYLTTFWIFYFYLILILIGEKVTWKKL